MLNRLLSTRVMFQHEREDIVLFLPDIKGEMIRVKIQSDHEAHKYLEPSQESDRQLFEERPDAPISLRTR